MDNNFTEFLRTEWSSFIKWTAGISTILISFTLTGLILRKSLTPFNIISACFTVGLLIFVIILFWLLLQRTISRIYRPLQKQLENQPLTKEEINSFKNIVKHADAWEKIINWIFLSGVASFIIFFTSIVFN